MASTPIPQSVRVALIWLGVFASAQLLMGLAWASFPLVAGALGTALLLWALACAQRWAFLLTFAALALIAIEMVRRDMALEGGAVLILGALVWVPLVMGRAWFFPSRRRTRRA